MSGLAAFRSDLAGRFARYPGDARRRAVGFTAALVLEALLLLMLLSLNREVSPPGRDEISVVEFATDNAAEEPEQEPQAETQAAPQPTPDDQSAQQPAQAAAPVAAPQQQDAVPVPPAPARVVLPIEAPAAPAPPTPTKPGVVLREDAMGPSAPRRSDDSRVVGTAPSGDPLYAAAWYREPGDSELRGYLSTASGPGWGLIACRTVPDFRVEDCVGLDEYPAGSNINRAVLAAAWQFRVRPPRRGGQMLVGAWVRIRIDYETRPQGG